VSQASLEGVAKYFFKAYLNEKLKFTYVLFLKEIQFRQNSFFWTFKICGQNFIFQKCVAI